MTRSPPPQPLEVLKTLLPAALALIGVSVFNGVASLEIRQRYQTAADILVYVSVAGIAVSIFAAVYPFACERPVTALSRYLKHVNAMKVARRNFRTWIPRWGELTSVLYSATGGESLTDDQWRCLDAKYSALRTWLLDHEGLASGEALAAALKSVDAQWGGLTYAEHHLKRDGFFSLFRHERLLFQSSHFRADSLTSGEKRHPEFTLSGLWDGLNRYSISKRWGPIPDWREFQAKDRTSAHETQNSPAEVPAIAP